MDRLAAFSMSEMNDLKISAKSPMLGIEIKSAVRRALAARRLGD